MKTKLCKTCGQEFTGLRKACNRCRISGWRLRTKQRLVKYKGGKCQTCGYNRNLSSLDFHHYDSNKKDFGISKYSKGIDLLKKEVDKCILLCSNCHGEVHSSKRLNVSGDKRRMFDLYEKINSLPNKVVYALATFNFTCEHGYNPHFDTMSNSMTICFLPDCEVDKRINVILEQFKDLKFTE